MRSTKDDVLCVGDVGIGFSGVGITPSLSKRFYFIRGNHDNPFWAKNHPQFAGDYGMWRDIFVLGGARSVDKHTRRENIDWWKDEELSYRELQTAIEIYRETKPNVVVSHDAPFSLQHELKDTVVAVHPETKQFGNPVCYSTVAAMDAMLEIHLPELWVFGHWHMSWSKQVGRTRFVCADVFELLDLDEQLALSRSARE